MTLYSTTPRFVPVLVALACAPQVQSAHAASQESYRLTVCLVTVADLWYKPLSHIYITISIDLTYRMYLRALCPYIAMVIWRGQVVVTLTLDCLEIFNFIHTKMKHSSNEIYYHPFDTRQDWWCARHWFQQRNGKTLVHRGTLLADGYNCLTNHMVCTNMLSEAFEYILSLKRKSDQ